MQSNCYNYLPVRNESVCFVCGLYGASELMFEESKVDTLCAYIKREKRVWNVKCRSSRKRDEKADLM
jgi:hypothetical protein